MKNIIKCFVVFSLLLSVSSLVSCVKDRGDYDYSDIPELQMANFGGELNGANVVLKENTPLVIEQGDLLKIVNNEKIDFKAEYSWAVGERAPKTDLDGNYPKPEVVATEKDFNQKFTFAPGNYNIYYTVTNKDNGSKFYMKFQIDVSSISGLFVVSVNAQGQGDYCAIRNAELMPNIPESKFGVNPDLYSLNNGGAKLDQPTNVFCITGRRTVKTVFIPVRENMISIDYNSLKVFNSNYETLFTFKPDGLFDAQTFVRGGNNTEYLVAGGKVYSIWYPGGGSAFGPSIGKAGKTYAPFVAVIPNPVLTQVVFNATDKRFEEMDIFGGPGEFGNGGGPVDITNTEMDLIYCENGNGNVFDAVMKDGSGQLFYVRFNLTKAAASICEVKLPLSSLAGMSADSKWAIGARGDASFYTSGHEVYVFNNKLGTSASANLGLPASAKITVIKVLKDATNSVYDNGLLMLGVVDGENSKYYQYAFNPLSGAVDLSSKKTVDVAGKIVGMELKSE